MKLRGFQAIQLSRLLRWWVFVCYMTSYFLILFMKNEDKLLSLEIKNIA